MADGLSELFGLEMVGPFGTGLAYRWRMERRQSLAEAAQGPVPRSFWRDRLARLAAPLDIHEYLIDEANLRGFWGAYRTLVPQRHLDPTLDLEDVVVGLMAPQAPSEARVFKLVLRILQSGKLNLTRLILRAKRERASGPLYWLLQQVPEDERNPAVQALQSLLSRPPRGYRPLRYRYDARRLVRRPARKEDLWHKLRQRSSSPLSTSTSQLPPSSD